MSPFRLRLTRSGSYTHKIVGSDLTLKYYPVLKKIQIQNLDSIKAGPLKKLTFLKASLKLEHNKELFLES